MKSPVAVWRRQKRDRIHLGKEGTIVSWTEIFVASPEYDSHTPYTVVLVEISGKERTYGQLVDFSPNDRKIGKKVRAILRRSADVRPEAVLEYGMKFVPIS